MDEFKINTNDKGRGLYTTQEYNPGDTVLVLLGNMFQKATRTSIQLGEQHIESWEGAHVNHHCDPNTNVIHGQLIHDHVARPFLQATKYIAKGEEVTFDYESNEKKLASPFYCKCCNRLIKGYEGY